MDNLFLVGLSQQMALRRQLDVVANNIANMNTGAFKGESMVFEEHLVKTQSADPTARKLAFVRDIATIRDTTEGRLETTGGPLDLAVSGDGYFAVGTKDGERYTRDGHFMLDAQGRVVNGQGHPLLSADGQEFTVQPNESDITIARDGSLSTNQGSKGRVKLVSFANEGALLKAGDSLYSADQTPAPSKGQVIQGAIEQSNVKPVIEITKMMDLVRTYEQVDQIMKQADELQKTSVKELGQVPA